jgi:hypothetical protein
VTISQLLDIIALIFIVLAIILTLVAPAKNPRMPQIISTLLYSAIGLGVVAVSITGHLF